MPNKNCIKKCKNVTVFKYNIKERCMIEYGSNCMNFNYKICELKKEITLLKKQLHKNNKKK